jgi:hypothetical protein
MLIEKLPDYPALKQLSLALWGSGDIRGASVMIGAGFSRNAVRPAATSPQPPLWRDFSEEITSQLYPTGNAPTDPLRLAQEYKVTLGDLALESLLRSKVQDEQWLPGQLHRQLLSLPWSDVLTTNWDRLLERAAETEPQRNYEVVYTPADIARKRSPRIVKLHGSLPSHVPLIFTEDDYRRYPQTHAPFVNLARQVLLENELCMLGFSGDDPNFLQWSGWIRDELGNSRRRIYLVGVLNLSSPSRALLESRGVIPIDLSPLVADYDCEMRHERATTLFIEFLGLERPKPLHAWPPELPAQEAPYPGKREISDSPEKAVVPLQRRVKRWVLEREIYPGWLICPAHKRQFIFRETQGVIANLAHVVPLLEEAFRGRAIYELLWRLNISFSKLDSSLRTLAEDAVHGQYQLGLTV